MNFLRSQYKIDKILEKYADPHIIDDVCLVLVNRLDVSGDNWAIRISELAQATDEHRLLVEFEHVRGDVGKDLSTTVSHVHPTASTAFQPELRLDRHAPLHIWHSHRGRFKEAVVKDFLNFTTIMNSWKSVAAKKWPRDDVSYLFPYYFPPTFSPSSIPSYSTHVFVSSRHFKISKICPLNLPTTIFESFLFFSRVPSFSIRLQMLTPVYVIRQQIQ